MTLEFVPPTVSLNLDLNFYLVDPLDLDYKMLVVSVEFLAAWHMWDLYLWYALICTLWWKHGDVLKNKTCVSLASILGYNIVFRESYKFLRFPCVSKNANYIHYSSFLGSWRKKFRVEISNVNYNLSTRLTKLTVYKLKSILQLCK